MLYNNQDQSSTGIELELSCSFDTFRSQGLSIENFKRLENDQFLFIDNGNFSSEFDLLDLDNYTYTKKDLITVLTEQYQRHEILDHSRYLFDKTLTALCKQELRELMEDMLLRDHMREDITELYSNYLTPTFEVLKVVGHCQGDQAEVIFTKDSIKEYIFKDRGQFLPMMQNYFENLFSMHRYIVA